MVGIRPQCGGRRALHPRVGKSTLARLARQPRSNRTDRGIAGGWMGVDHNSCELATSS